MVFSQGNRSGRHDAAMGMHGLKACASVIPAANTDSVLGQSSSCAGAPFSTIVIPCFVWVLCGNARDLRAGRGASDKAGR